MAGGAVAPLLLLAPPPPAPPEGVLPLPLGVAGGCTRAIWASMPSRLLMVAASALLSVWVCRGVGGRGSGATRKL